MPVQLATKTRFLINPKTAKDLGTTVPISLLGRADEVIEWCEAEWRATRPWGHAWRCTARSSHDR
jgi:hypothetical protein